MSFRVNEDTPHVYHSIDADGNQVWTPSPEMMKSVTMEEWYHNRTLMEAKHKAELEALNTFFPRGIPPIKNFDKMVDIARADLLNPLYEKVIAEFDEAVAKLHQASSKLACAVKMTDSELLEEPNVEDLNSMFQNVGLLPGTIAAKTMALSQRCSFDPATKDEVEKAWTEEPRVPAARSEEEHLEATDSLFKKIKNGLFK